MLILAICLIGCSSDQQAAAPQFVTPPRLVSDAAASPLAVIISFSSNKPVRAHYHIQTRGSSRQLFSDRANGNNSTNNSLQLDHRQPLVNFRAGYSYQIDITLEDKDGNKTAWKEPLLFSAPGLSDDFPVIEKSTGNSPKNNGVTLLNLFRYQLTQAPDGLEYMARDTTTSLILAIDNTLEPIWFFIADNRIDKIQQDSPHTLTLIGEHGRETINFLGRHTQVLHGVRQAFKVKSGKGAVQAINTDSLHSKQITLDNGNRLLLSTEMRIFDSYPQPLVNPEEPAPIQSITRFISDKKLAGAMAIGDQVIEINPQGNVVKRWNLFDLLDTQRQTYVSHLPDPKEIYQPNSQLGLPRSWSQANGIAYNRNTDTLLVSVKNQNAIIGINKTSGQLKWILGDPAGWQQPWLNKVLTPVKPADGKVFSWPYQPSSLHLNTAGEILLIDNGGYRSQPRVRVFTVDEQAMTVTARASYPHSAGSSLSRSTNKTDKELTYLHWLSRQYSAMTLSADGKSIRVAEGLSAQLSQLDLQTAVSTVQARLRAQPDSHFQWGIADIIHLPELTAAATDQLPVGARQIPPYLSSPSQQPEAAADKTPQKTNNVFGDSANSELPTIDITGGWQLKIGNDAEQQLTLNQDGQLLTGDLAGFPVIAWVKGNTFSMTVRRDNGIGQVRFRYRGVINQEADQMQGQVLFGSKDNHIAHWQWVADRR